MARLQILQLPEGSGDDRPPFVLVIDQADESLIEGIATASQSTAELIGARTVFVFTETIEIPANAIAWQAEPLLRVGEPLADDEVRRLAEERDELHAELGLARGQLHSAALSAIRGKGITIRELIERAEQAEAERDEARMWARHGYEIGQRHCSWTDHGVAPAWLTEGWPPHFDSCEHLKRAGEYDEALTRVRSLSEHPDIMDARHEQPDGYLHGYRVAIKDAKRAAQNPPTEGKA